MTQEEWLSSSDPDALLQWLARTTRPTSERKIRLFMCACYRRVEYVLRVPQTREILHLAERFAEGQADQETVARVLRNMLLSGESSLHWALCAAPEEVATYAAHDADRMQGWEIPTAQEKKAQVHLLRDVLGNPFHRREAVSSARLTWNGGTVRHLAQTIYENRRFDRMPILADALEEAGCADAAILEHCRGPGPHVRGCWVVDLVLCKE